MSNAKRHIITLIILVIAGTIAWWSSHTESSVSIHVQKEISKLVPRFHSDPSSIHSVVIDPVIESVLAMSLEFVYEESKKINEDYVVIVTSGDDGQFGDGTATHVAVFQIDDKPIAHLRVICLSDSDPVRIAGVFVEDRAGVMGAKTP